MAIQLGIYQRTGIVLVVGFLVLIIIDCGFAQAQQDTRGRRREFVEDLLKIVLDETGNGSPPKQQIRIEPQNLTPTLRQSIPEFASFSENVYELARIMQREANHTNGIRARMGDVIRINAAARSLAERSRRVDKLDPLREDFLEIDQNWQLFSRRLRDVYGLSSRIENQLSICDQQQQRLEQLFRVDPQVDRTQLAEHVTRIAGHLRDLQEDIEIEFGDSRQGQSLMSLVRRAYEQNRRVAYAVRNRDPHETIRDEYEEFLANWSPLARKLRELDDRHIQRHVRRIDEADRAMQQLLLLPPRFDPAAVGHLAEILHQHVNDMMDAVTLRSLTRLPSGHVDIIEAADGFSTSCTDFSDCVASGDDRETLAELYYYLEDDWQRVNNCLSKTNQEPVQVALREIQHSIDELRDLLGIQLAFDRKQVLARAASVEELAENFDQHVRAYMSRPNRYQRQFQIDVMKSSAGLHRSAQQLQQGIANGEDLKTLQQRSDTMTNQWKEVSPQMSRFNAPDRMKLNDLREQLAPALVELQALLTL